MKRLICLTLAIVVMICCMPTAAATQMPDCKVSLVASHLSANVGDEIKVSLVFENAADYPYGLAAFTAMLSYNSKAVKLENIKYAVNRSDIMSNSMSGILKALYIFTSTAKKPGFNKNDVFCTATFTILDSDVDIADFALTFDAITVSEYYTDSSGKTKVNNYQVGFNSPTVSVDILGNEPPVQSNPTSSQISASSSAPAVSTPTASAPAVSTPVESAPAVSTPTVSTPVESTPAASAPAVSSPVESTPAASAPAVSSPVESAPAASAPAVSTPVESSPVESTPDVSTPAESSPVESAPAASSPIESSSSANKPSAVVNDKFVDVEDAADNSVAVDIFDDEGNLSSETEIALPESDNVESSPVTSEPANSVPKGNDTLFIVVISIFAATVIGAITAIVIIIIRKKKD